MKRASAAVFLFLEHLCPAVFLFVEHLDELEEKYNKMLAHGNARNLILNHEK